MSEVKFSKPEILAIRKLILRDVLPGFHGAVAEAITDFGHEYSNRQRVNVGNAMLMTMAEGLCSIWADNVDLPEETGYETMARQLTSTLPCWLGVCEHARVGASDASEECDASEEDKDVDAEAAEFATHAAPYMAKVGELIDECIAGLPKSADMDRVAISLFGALGEFFNARFAISDDPQRLGGFATAVLTALGCASVNVSTRKVD